MVYLYIPIVKVNISAPFCLQKYFPFDSDDIRVCLCPFPFYPVLCTLRCQICDADKNWSAWDKPSHFYLIFHCKDFLYWRAQFKMYFLCCCFKCLADFLQTQWTSLFFLPLGWKKKKSIYLHLWKVTLWKKMSSRNCQEMISFASDALTLNFEVWLCVHRMSKCALHCSWTRDVFRSWRISNFAGAESRKWHHRQQTVMYELCPGRWQIRLSVSKADVKSRFKNVYSPWVLKVSSAGLLQEL